MGVEPTGRRFPDVPLALKARRVTGPYSLPPEDYNQQALWEEMPDHRHPRATRGSKESFPRNFPPVQEIVTLPIP